MQAPRPFSSVIPPDQLTPHFHLDEFRCPCCGDVIRNNALLLAQCLEPVREEYGPIRIKSGYRCPTQNQVVGGALMSQHMTGLAADITIDGDKDRFTLVKLLMKHGFRRLGIAKSVVHCDIGRDQVDVIWTYY